MLNMAVSEFLIDNWGNLTLALVVIVIVYFEWEYHYWNRRNVPYLRPYPPFGNVGASLRGKENGAVSMKKLYDKMKAKKWKFGGFYMFTEPIFLPIDLDLVKNILIGDFEHFEDRSVFYNEKEPLQAHLLNFTGRQWWNLRKKLTPIFTPSKMKNMFNIMVECQNDLRDRMDKESEKNEPINIREILACFATNIIGSCVFGLDFKALEDEDSEFRRIGRILFRPSRCTSFKRSFARTFPVIGKLLMVEMLDKNVAEFVKRMVQNAIDLRKKDNFYRNDFMQLMINLKNHEDKPFTLDEIASQALVFYAAGFETTSTLMAFVLYELARRQDIQEKLRDEIKSVLTQHKDQISYESIQDMAYLGQVIDETLRMHPGGGLLNRKCVKDYKVPDSDVVIKKGIVVNIPVLGIHYDNDFYPNPEEFDPGRFTPEEKGSRSPAAYLPWGEGQRNCIGMRFGLLQSKVGLVALLLNYNFTVNAKTKQPVVYHPGSDILIAEEGIWLNAQRI